MKTKFKQLTLSVSILVLSLLFHSCGNNEKQVVETPKVNTADLFKDDRAAYDAKAIDPSAPVSEIAINAVGLTMAEMSYDPKTITVKSGTTIKLKFTNLSKDEAMPHNWVLVYPGTMESVAQAGLSAGMKASFIPESRDVLVAINLLGPGATAELTFPAPAAGKYEYVCTYPGHWSVMHGVLIVE